MTIEAAIAIQRPNSGCAQVLNWAILPSKRTGGIKGLTLLESGADGFRFQCIPQGDLNLQQRTLAADHGDPGQPFFTPTSTRRLELEELGAPTTSSMSICSAMDFTASWRLVVA